MTYTQFLPNRDRPLQQANWANELNELQQSALDAISRVMVAVAYVWTLAQLMATHPMLVTRPLVVPLAVAALGTLVMLVRPSLPLRRLLFVGGVLVVAALGIFIERFAAAPFVCLVAVTCAALIPGPTAAFAAAAASSAMLGTAIYLLPGQWPGQLLVGALALCWTNATVAWLTSRNLHSVLSFALRGYEESWRTTRTLQVERGKLSRTLKDLSDANLLLKRTTYDLAEAREEAERARQMKAQFAANISHELRTPLHLIVGFSQMMHMSPDNYPGVVWTPELRGDVQEIYESATHLLHLIDDVLDLSQIEAARLPISKERIALAPLIRDAVDTAASLLRNRDLYLHVDLPEELPPVYADPTRVRQTLLNLLNNAARFTEQGGITVSARVLQDEIEVTVTDTGIGIPADELDRIFSEFHQVDGSLRRKYGGTGLGLALCKQFVALHGGRIWAESELGKGSSLHFTLPLPEKRIVPLQHSELPPGWRYPATRPGTGHRLVVLAQQPELSRVLSRYLPDAEILEAADEEEAVRCAHQAKADAIVLAADSLAASPEASGAGSLACNSLGNSLAKASADILLPIITCSWPLEQQLALAQGFTHCLMKPFTGQRLLETLAQAAPQAERLLVVDDDPGVGRLVERSLSSGRHKVQVITAYDGEEAVQALDQKPDIVLLDLVLPRLDGLGVLAELRSRPWGQQVPVVAITAYGFQQDVAKLGQGFISVQRGKYFSASEITRWLGTVLTAFPARHLEPGTPGPEPALAGPD